jgi:hypothetical protein
MLGKFENRTITVLLFVLGGVLHGSLFQTVQGQSAFRRTRVPVLETYQLTLDKVFPRENDGAPGHYFLTVRYLPSFHLESQITVTRRPDGKDEVVLLKLADGSRSIWEQLQEAIGKAGSLPDPQEFAKQVKVERKVVKVPAKELARVLELFSQISLSIDLKKHVLTVDGELYELWFDSGQITINWSTNYGGYLGSGDPPFVQWANELRRTVMLATDK